MTRLTIQPNDAAGYDTSIDSSNPNTNRNANTDMWVGELNDRVMTQRAVIKFDLSDLPADAIISSAVLSIWQKSDKSSNARTFRVYRLKRAWVEDEVTWNVYSTGNAWQTAGGFGANDCEQADIGSRAFTATETNEEFKAFTLTPTTKAGLDLGNGWLIKADTESNDAYDFRASNDDTAGYRPKLMIEYELPAGYAHSFGVVF